MATTYKYNALDKFMKLVAKILPTHFSCKIRIEITMEHFHVRTIIMVRRITILGLA